MSADMETRLRSGMTVDGDCWRWVGTRLNRDGYGRITVLGRSLFVHRLAYETWVGPIPDGMQIDHVVARGCRHRNCINPAHLEVVTPLENVTRGWWGRDGRPECKNGHPFDGYNLRFSTKRTGRDQRVCRTCIREATARYRDRKRRGIAA